MALPARSEIEQKYTWNAESVYKDAAAWQTDTENLLKQIEAVGAFKGKLAGGATVLADFIDAADSITRLISKIYFYAGMSSAVEMNNAAANAMVNKAAGLYGQTLAAVSFFDPELLAIGQDTLKQWMTDEPRLAMLGHYVDNLFRKQAHVRSAEVEEVLGLAQDPFGSIENSYEMLTTLDIPFPPAIDSKGNEHTVAQSTIDGFKSSPDRELRRSAYESYTGQYLQFKNAITGTYLTSVKRDVFNMRVRSYKSSLEAALFESNIPTDVFMNLIETFKKNLPTWHKYWDIRRKVLGLDKIHPYDIWAPLTDNAPNNSYEQAVQWVLEGMAPMGEDYLEPLRKGCLEQRWVDVMPNEGKRQGAFSWGTYDTHPFLMVSYDGSMGAVSTLAHELGHSMHSYYANKTQPNLYANYSMFAAETASNFQQAMVRAYLQTVNDDVDFQIAIIEEAMDNFHRYFFIMPTLARFEYEVHTRAEQGIGMTADDLNALCADLFAEGYGDTMTFDRDRESVTWSTFGHLYLNFYVFQYATGISAANFLAQEVMNGVDGAVQRYIDFVSAGGSMHPLDALKKAGVDMSKPDAVEAAFKVLADMVDRLAKLTGV